MKQNRRPSLLPLNLWRDCQHNIGDKVASPIDYFPIEARRKDVWGITAADLQGRQIILGGGGLACFRESMAVLEPFAANVIVWGIGGNQHIVSPTPLQLPSFLDRCKLVGIRDFGQGFEWVPCASCMSPLFDHPATIQHEVGFYGHWEIPLPQAGQPYLQNNCTFAEAISFLGSCAVVVTNSYHGVYWATLLGRKVLVWPTNTKFFHFKHQPRIIRNGQWSQNLKDAVAYPEALAECRAANQAFYVKVAAALTR